jgi:phage shock protein PspC (stress-responsive transcriptional regulator)
VIGGLCGGLAEFIGMESFLWRIGFIAFALLGGEGILVYLLLWLLIPDSDRPPPDGSDAGGTGFVQRLRTGMTSSR